MSYFFFIGFLLGSFVLPGCSPALNWRDVRLDQTPLQALFPCKPERAAREVTLGDQVLTLNLLACDVGDVKFALAFADTADASGTGALWRSGGGPRWPTCVPRHLMTFLRISKASAPWRPLPPCWPTGCALMAALSPCRRSTLPWVPVFFRHLFTRTPLNPR